jgi:predicted AAA+ superfamily ATPase
MVYQRLLRLPAGHSFFLFGPRGTGKSTLVEGWMGEIAARPSVRVVHIDLLDPTVEARYSLDPGRLKQEIEVHPAGSKLWVVIDEVQKVPALLDVAHWAIHKKKAQFCLTGSSARKLKRGAANLLAGRAFDLHLYPLTARELGRDFKLESALRYGTLPGHFSIKEPQDKERFLESYIQTYLREEIQLEQIVRNITRFRRFLSFAGQMNTKVLSFSKIAEASGVDEKSVNRYFEILEDTLVGVLLEPYDRSIRSRQRQKPKFYLFDTGVACQMREDYQGRLLPGTSIFGELFEQWVVLECHRLRDYFETRDQFYYLRTKDEAEVDLIIERRGLAPVLVEIKSSERVNDSDLRHLRSLSKDLKHSRKLVLCRETKARVTDDGIEILPFLDGLAELYPETRSGLKEP